MFEQPIVVSSSLRSAMLALVAGGVALFLAERLERPVPHRHTVELLLTAPVDGNAFYASAWADGPVYVTLAEGEPIAFTRTIHWVDHCDWVAHEFLIPDGAGAYRYTYEEWPVACERGFRPFPATPRQGRVHAVIVDDATARDAALTQRNATIRYHHGHRHLSCPFVDAHAFGSEE